MKRWALVLLVSVGLLGVVVASHEWLLEEYAAFFHVDDAAPGADAIVVLSHPSIERLMKAFALREAGFSEVLLLTETTKPKPLFEDLFIDKMTWVLRIAEKLEHEVEPVIVPSLKDGAVSTWDEAFDLLAHSQREGFSRIIIVTNAFHTRRSIHAFREVFDGSGIEVEVAAADNPSKIGAVWWQSDSGLQAYITEFFKFAFYLFHEGNVPFIRNDA